ncbi:MAG: TonB-dependent siderophore receptor [Bacteroidetes bacterium]|nr:TonB-dependent siderophore receptor [Bacteroidota bacterium]MBS1972707.1 TonB-dependent siderophore receptor [Bacteroidota bacterium]
MKYISTLALALFSIVPLFAQKNGSIIKGRIFTADSTTAYVSVELKHVKKVTFTDNKGYFKFQNLPSLTDTLIITSIESKVILLPITVGLNGTTDLGNIYLSYNIRQLRDVEVNGRLPHSFKNDYSFIGTKTQTPVIDIPQSVSSITKELIKDKMEFTVKEAVDAAAGVNQYSGFDEYTIRGFKAENARLINGLRGYATTYTSAMLVNIERIEVIKGPAAALYGNCDPGGTVNLVTKKPLDKTQGEINAGGGTWGHFRTAGDITGPITKSKTLLYRFNGGYDNTKSFRNDVYAKSYQLAPSFSFAPNEKIQLNVDFSLSHINTVLDRGQPGFQNDFSLKSTPISLSASQPGDYLHETDIASNLLFSYKINKHISFNSGYLNYITQQNVAGHGVHSYITNDSVNLYYSTWNYHTMTNSFSNYFSFHFNTGKLSHQLIAGYDFISSDVKLNQRYFEVPDQFGAGSGIVGTFSLRSPKYFARPVDQYKSSSYNSFSTNVDGGDYSTQGIYAQEQVSLDKWKLLLGLRQELYSSGDEDDPADSSDRFSEHLLLPRIGIVYELKPNISIYATYSKGFDPFEASASTQIFNAPFRPITSQLLEAGAKADFFSNKLSATISLYQLALQNVAVNANDISNPNLFVQQGEDRSRGIETEVNGNILPNLSVALSYAYCVARVIKSKVASQVGTIVENAPRNSSNSWIRYNFAKGAIKGFGIAIGHSQASSRTTLQQNLMLPGYFVLNAGLRYNYKHIAIAVNFNNITNKTYWLGAYNNVSKWPGEIRNFMLNIGYNF